MNTKKSPIRKPVSISGIESFYSEGKKPLTDQFREFIFSFINNVSKIATNLLIIFLFLIISTYLGINTYTIFLNRDNASLDLILNAISKVQLPRELILPTLLGAGVPILVFLQKEKSWFIPFFTGIVLLFIFNTYYFNLDFVSFLEFSESIESYLKQPIYAQSTALLTMSLLLFLSRTSLDFEFLNMEAFQKISKSKFREIWIWAIFFLTIWLSSKFAFDFGERISSSYIPYDVGVPTLNNFRLLIPQIAALSGTVIISTLFFSYPKKFEVKRKTALVKISLLLLGAFLFFQSFEQTSLSAENFIWFFYLGVGYGIAFHPIRKAFS